MIVLLSNGAGFSARRVGWLDRVKDRLRGPHLDELLARGTAPETSLALALHVARLARPSQRRLIAGTLKRLGCEPRQGPRLRPVPINRTVSDAAAELDALADCLLSGGPVNVRGVAKIRLLLADGTGPLYRAGSDRDLQAELVDAMSSVDPLG